ncbi:MAG: bacillithiol biosynthesis cysteine-adding enzyme BshC [Deinococcales bacterium]|nr:bacillithiol biosynthesis cysteine-adding enzyme BshC [Deinococcales bacterium]
MSPEPTHRLPTDFTAAYGSGALADFFELPPGDTAAALTLDRPVDRERLARALERYARKLGAPAAVLENVEKLRHPQARAVVTGQQTGLLLGPTFTLSKAVTAIRLARQLDTPERPVVPVFWLATQDHDTAEVDHTYVLDGDEALHRLAVELPRDVPVGRVPLSRAMVSQVLAGLAACSPAPRFLPEVTALLEETAASVATFSDWFGAVLMRLLGEEGLVPVDPLQPDLAALTTGVLRAELEQPGRSTAAINEAGDRLAALGFEPQLGRGANATNLFLELPGAGLPRRVLLRLQGRSFFAEGRELSRAELLARLEDDPTLITPAAGLRPVVQDALLPTAVAVFGPGELRYVAQLRGVYRAHGVAMPLAWPRAVATVLEPAAQRLLERYGLSAVRFRGAPRAELERVLLERHGFAERFGSAVEQVEETFERLLGEVQGIDPTLGGTVERGRRHLELTLRRLRDKSAAALAERDATTRRQFARLEAHLLPLGQPAERVLTPFSHALKFGLEPLLERFLALEPSGEQELRV